MYVYIIELFNNFMMMICIFITFLWIYNTEYILEREIGRGSYGVVRRVWSTTSQEWYAMKIMNRSLLKKRRIFQAGMLWSDQWQQVKKEIAIMKKLDHPNIVRLVEVMNDEKTDHLYLVMEYCVGGSLGNGELDTPPLPLSIARHYFRDAVAGLEYLHMHRIIHRDIKPENLLLTETGQLKIGIHIYIVLHICIYNRIYTDYDKYIL